jgi:hypothetical protein
MISFTLGMSNPSSHFIGGWMGARTGLDVAEKGKIWPLLEIELPSSSLYQVLFWLSNVLY